jgi:hypothetical protein
MNPYLITAIISAAAALLGSIIGGLFAMWTATRAHKRQLELQRLQLKAQTELKARELMFVVYQKKMEGFNQDIKDLGGVIGKFGAAVNLPDMEEKDKTDAMLSFIATVRVLTNPILERMDEIEGELREAELLTKFERQLSFVKAHLSSDPTTMTFQQVANNFQNLSKALTYITELQHALVEKKSDELFGEYLPQSPVRNRFFSPSPTTTQVE